VSVVTRQEMEMRQPTTVKEALSYTPSVFSTRGSSTTYDVVTIRGFTTSTTVNTNQYLDGMKLQGNNYSEVSMDPYFLERGSDARANLGAVRQQQPGRYRQHGQQTPDHRAAERSAV
jgi:iron complex outermembrane receptor protein